MENGHSKFSPSSLLCDESLENFHDDDEETNDLDNSNDEAIEKHASNEDDENFIQLLLDKEITTAEILHLHEPWIQEARSHAINNYILSTMAIFGITSRAAYLSVTYMDRYLSRKRINAQNHWRVKLLAMASLSTAAKMEGCEDGVPRLSMYSTQEYNYNNSSIKRMELMLLSELEWKMNSVIPYDFIDYIVSKLCNDSPFKNITNSVEEIVLGAVKDINIMSTYLPSVIAAASTLIALDRRLTRENLDLKLNGLPSSWFANIQHIWLCYNQLKDLDMATPPLTPNELQNIRNQEMSRTFVSIGAKRKRIGFDESEMPPHEK